jgi:glycosyltransferase involved in cell wall biosynthesis
MRGKLPPVLFMADHFGYADGVAHGVTTYFLHILPALVQQGIDLKTVFLREPHPAAAGLLPYGIEPIFLSAHKWDPSVALKVAAIARKHRAKVVHASGVKATLVGRVAAHMVGAEAIVHVHDLDYPSFAVSALHRLFARPKDIGLCVSNAVQENTAEGYHIARDKLRVVYNGVRLDHVRNVPANTRERIRRSLNIAPDRVVVAMVARLYPVKGHKGMLKMMPRIAKAVPNLTLMIVGDGPERADLETMVDELHLRPNVLFVGHRNDVPEMLAAADMAVMPSLSEGLGVAAIEALAAGKPVVAFDTGGLREVVTDGADGRVVPAGDHTAFSDAVISLASDPHRIRTWGERGIALTERFSVDAHVARLVQCYEEAANSSTPPLAFETPTS